MPTKQQGGMWRLKFSGMRRDVSYLLKLFQPVLKLLEKQFDSGTVGYCTLRELQIPLP